MNAAIVANASASLTHVSVVTRFDKAIDHDAERQGRDQRHQRGDHEPYRLFTLRSVRDREPTLGSTVSLTDPCSDPHFSRCERRGPVHGRCPMRRSALPTRAHQPGRTAGIKLPRIRSAHTDPTRERGAAALAAAVPLPHQSPRSRFRSVWADPRHLLRGERSTCRSPRQSTDVTENFRMCERRLRGECTDPTGKKPVATHGKRNQSRRDPA